MRIALVNLPLQWGERPEEKSRALGLGYLASSLMVNGFTVEILDCHNEQLTINITKDRIFKFNPDMIGISMIDQTIPRLSEFLIELLNFHGHITIGGYGATFWKEKLLATYPQINSVIIGEGEITISKLAYKLSQELPWKNTKGIAFMEDGKIHITPSRELISDLDSLPLPVRNGVTDAEVIAASRGCYANCNFCSINNFYRLSIGEIKRYRDPIKVVDELESLNGKWTEYIMFSDDNFLGLERARKGWIKMFTSEIKRRNLSLIFSIQSRVNDIKADLLADLYSVGLRYVGLGIESNSVRMLKDFNKGTTPQLNRFAVDTLKNLRIYYNVFIILYDAYTTLDELYENLDFLESIDYSANPAHFRKPVSTLNRLMIFPGTKSFQDYYEKRLLNQDNFIYNWKFVNNEVSVYYNMMQKWIGSITSKFLSCESLRLNRILQKEGNLGLSRQVYNLSKSYLISEIAMMKDMISALKEEREPHIVLEKYSQISMQIIQHLNELKNKVLESNEKV